MVIKRWPIFPWLERNKTQFPSVSEQDQFQFSRGVPNSKIVGAIWIFFDLSFLISELLMGFSYKLTTCWDPVSYQWHKKLHRRCTGAQRRRGPLDIHTGAARTRVVEQIQSELPTEDSRNSISVWTQPGPYSCCGEDFLGAAGDRVWGGTQRRAASSKCTQENEEEDPT